MKYLSRIADNMLKDRLALKGAVLITGPKWCGKSTTALNAAGSYIFMQDPETQRQNIEMARFSPSTLLEGKTPRLIDEWQIVPEIWDAIRFEVDKRRERGQFILTGSVTPADKSKDSHSGIGRITNLHMRPMSLFESRESDGSISLEDIFKGRINPTVNGISLRKYAFAICRGGWPEAVLEKEDRYALAHAYDYVDTLCESEIRTATGKIRDNERCRRILRSYARNMSTPASLSLIRKDVIGNNADSFNDRTLYEYINALKDLFVVEDLPAWNPNIRSKARIQSAEIRHFIDPSIGVAAIGCTPDDLVDDIKTFGLYFESLCIRDLRIYAEAIGGSVYHYRDSNGLEADAVIHLHNGSYALVEIKLGSEDSIEQGAANLQKLAALIDTDKMKKPSALIIITAKNNAYRRKDGVYVVPLSCLKP